MVACKCAYHTDEYSGWGCTVTDGACMFLIPNSKLCAEEYGEGPDADDTDDDNEWTVPTLNIED